MADGGHLRPFAVLERPADVEVDLGLPLAPGFDVAHREAEVQPDRPDGRIDPDADPGPGPVGLAELVDPPPDVADAEEDHPAEEGLDPLIPQQGDDLFDGAHQDALAADGVVRGGIARPDAQLLEPADRAAAAPEE